MNPSQFINKYKRYLSLAEDKNRVGPPEAIWYGLWNHLFCNIAANDEDLLVFPQLDLRIATTNKVKGCSTRYTDIALQDTFLKWSGAGYRSQLVALVEVKPGVEKGASDHDDAEEYDSSSSEEMEEDEGSIGVNTEKADVDKGRTRVEERRAAVMLTAMTEVIVQVKHYFSQLSREDRSEVVMIASVGSWYRWAVYKKTDGTPAKDSRQTASLYQIGHQGGDFTTPWGDLQQIGMTGDNWTTCNFSPHQDKASVVTLKNSLVASITYTYPVGVKIMNLPFRLWSLLLQCTERKKGLTIETLHGTFATSQWHPISKPSVVFICRILELTSCTIGLMETARLKRQSRKI
ncbi:hypothetical protein CPB83DRAFT_835816 [Crepidotus variabilis]|uniref:Uncharacterized protein n=1 Tax=Crepidotus variabilis TaxID=179855 RepID=A0A9P6EFG9_9AGAR|nr:hypothetical protein CPB83DRAFT_835816 [Crepidotus variabilis]